MPEVLASAPALLQAWLGLLGRLSLYGGILLVLALAVQHLWPRRATTLHHVLWTLVVLRFLLPPGAAFRFSLAALLQDWLPGGTTASTTVLPAGDLVSSAASGVPTAIPWMQAGLLGLWLSGALLVAGLLGTQWWRTRALLHGGYPADDPMMDELLGLWRRRLHIRRRVRVLLARGLPGPFTMGLLRPVIALPEEAAGWPRERMEAILAHELAHVARLDVLWLRLENLVQVLRPLPEGLADAAAEAVRRWTFEPARDADGHAVPVLFKVAVRFALDGDPASSSSASRAGLPEGWTPPRVKDAQPPAYPEEARRRHLQGTVRLELAIGADGSVKEVTVLEGLPAGLTDAAVEAVRHWTFEPALDAKGRPVGITQVVGVRFRLDEGDEAAGV